MSNSGTVSNRRSNSSPPHPKSSMVNSQLTPYPAIRPASAREECTDLLRGSLKPAFLLSTDSPRLRPGPSPGRADSLRTARKLTLVNFFASSPAAKLPGRNSGNLSAKLPDASPPP